jgi:hypothetical protein
MSQQAIQSVGGSLTDATVGAIGANFGELYGRIFASGNVYYCNAISGDDTNGDGTAAKPFSTLAAAYGKCVSGHNDVVVIVGDGASTGTQRVTAAITWDKDATHLIGICSPSMYGQRARIAPGTAASAYTPLMTLSGSGCLFANIQFWHGFATGTTNQIALAITGDRNVFRNCHIAGMGDAASAANSGSRCIKFTSADENLFENCVIGIDTVTRSAANANVEYATGSARNTFRSCHFPMYGTGGSALAIKTTAASAMDRVNVFEDCMFLNASTTSGGAAITALATLTAAGGGCIVMKGCTLVGITDFFSDASTAAQMFLDGAAPTSNTSGLAVNPT